MTENDWNDGRRARRALTNDLSREFGQFSFDAVTDAVLEAQFELRGGEMRARPEDVLALARSKLAQLAPLHSSEHRWP